MHRENTMRTFSQFNFKLITIFYIILLLLAFFAYPLPSHVSVNVDEYGVPYLLSVDPNYQHIVYISYDTVVFFDLNLKLENIIRLHPALKGFYGSAVWNEDSSKLALIRFDGSITIIDIRTYEIQTLIDVTVGAFNAGQDIYFISNNVIKTVFNNSIVQIDIKTQEISKVVSITGKEKGTQWSPQGDLLLVHDVFNEETLILNSSNGTVIHKLYFEYVKTYLWSPNGRYLALLDIHQTKAVPVIDLEEDRVINSTIPIGLENIESYTYLPMAWNKDSTNLAISLDTSETTSSRIYVWNIQSHTTETWYKPEGWKIFPNLGGWYNLVWHESTGRLIFPIELKAEKNEDFQLISMFFDSTSKSQNRILMYLNHFRPILRIIIALPLLVFIVVKTKNKLRTTL